jgi:hypothetical protein
MITDNLAASKVTDNEAIQQLATAADRRPTR